MGNSETYSPVPEGYDAGRTKYVIVLGTVMSGLGKGIFIGSLARALQNRNISISPIKLEGYFNFDSGTLNPIRHGEVFVLDDGTECDMDLGNYERMLNLDLSRLNFSTSGRVFSSILERERSGGYLGRDVQMVPHVTGEVKMHLRELAMDSEADIVFVEIGGTVGDLENGVYIEACRQLAAEEGSSNVCFVTLTYILAPPSLGEQKSKPAQMGLRELMSRGIMPNIVACRAESEVTTTVKEKLSMFAGVPGSHIFSMHDVESVCLVPNMIQQAGLDDAVLKILNMPTAQPAGSARDAYALKYRKAQSTSRRAKIGITGKYTALRDSYASIMHALEHAAIEQDASVELQWIDTDGLDDGNVALTMAKEDVDGIVVPGGFGVRGAEGKMACIRYARETMLPFLGICYGFQLAAIEFARNECGIPKATTSEIDPDAEHKIIDILPNQTSGQLGGTMRLGGHDVSLREKSFAHGMYFGADTCRLRFRHRYEMVSRYVSVLESKGLVFSGSATDGSGVKQILELPGHPFFVATQAHPEMTSRPSYPEPMFRGLVKAAISRRSQ